MRTWSAITGSDGRSAHRRRVQDETVIITHPCHPRSGQEVHVLQCQRDGSWPNLVVEFPDLSTQRIPLTWTSRADPSGYRVGASSGARLSGPALLDLLRLLEEWAEEA